MVRAGRRVYPRFAPFLVCAVALGGCVSTTGTGTGPAMGDAAQAVSGPGQRVIERDVEAPNVFQVAEAGLWDGRPSLGGVWIAHPDVTDPERAMIRNTATGATVIGALFRRERENPGPRFQISSEAANALGILPGAPTEVSVTALRLQRVEMEIDPAPEPTTAAAETLAIAPVETAAAPAVSSAVVPSGAPVDQVAITAITDEEPPRRGLRGLFGRRDRTPEPATIAETTLAPAAGAATVATATAAAVPAVAEPPRQRRSLRDLFRRRDPEPDTTMIALPGVTPDAVQPASQPTPPPASAAAPQPQPSRLDRPFVQIGIFSVEQNAQNARSQMQRAGLSAEIRRGRVGENLFWRVVVGPAGTTAERAENLRRVQGLGFADAYAVVR